MKLVASLLSMYGINEVKKMAKVFMTCGKICSGKSTYAQKIRKNYNAVILSVDEITLALFGQDTGENHDHYVEMAEAYLYEKSLEIIDSGINVVLDWGFWTESEREYARSYYSSRGIDYEFHYIDISTDEWAKRLKKRNKDILEHKSNNYYVDEGLAEKSGNIFETPTKDEIDVWVKEC